MHRLTEGVRRQRLDDVRWSDYATQYDLLVAHSPAYQALQGQARGVVLGWELRPGAVLADLGAGTGNLSIELAVALPHVHVLHVERDPEMLRRAEEKAAQRGLANWSAVPLDLASETWALPPLDAAVTVNAIYALPHPGKAIDTMVRCLRPGGLLFASSFGRKMNVLDWGWHVARYALRTRGLWRSLELLRCLGAARRENARIRDLQDTGVYWAHDLSAFRNAFEQAGAQVLHATDQLYRGYNDTIVARRTA